MVREGTPKMVRGVDPHGDTRVDGPPMDGIGPPMDPGSPTGWSRMDAPAMDRSGWCILAPRTAWLPDVRKNEMFLGGAPW